MVMKDEYDALIENKTLELVPLPSNANFIWSFRIFRHKKKSDGSFEWYKARLVSNGINQQSGADYGGTFSPVVKPATIHMVLGIKLSKSWCLHQLDIKNSFFMEFLTKLCICTSLLDSVIHSILSMFVFLISLYMVSNNHFVPGTKDSLTMLPHLVSLTSSFILLYSFIIIVFILLISFYMWMT